jgi:RimJ/RimL family protein N-acetyltransferase
VTGPAPVVLAGRRVRLEPLAPGHAEALAEAAAGDRSTFGLTQVPDGVPQAKAYVARALAEAADGASLAFATVLVQAGRVVGSTRFMTLEYWPVLDDGRGPDVPVVAEIGHTWLAPSAQRTGANAEAKYLMLRHAFETWRVARVSLKTDARNARSRAAIERLGARCDGVLRAHMPA